MCAYVQTDQAAAQVKLVIAGMLFWGGISCLQRNDNPTHVIGALTSSAGVHLFKHCTATASRLHLVPTTVVIGHMQRCKCGMPSC